MTTTKIPMQEFCCDWSTRFALGKPWRKGDWIYATDTRILIRCSPESFDGEVETAETLGERKIPKNSDEILADCAHVSDWHDMPAVENCSVCSNTGYIEGDCEECCGDGVCECDMEYEHDCDECEGTGVQTIDCTRCPREIKVGNRNMAMRIVRKLMLLPGVKYGVATDNPGDAILLKFEGGVGAAMPLNPDVV